MISLEFIKENGEIVEGIIRNYEMSNDGWYYGGNYYEPEELPDSWVETMIIELEDGYNLDEGNIITVDSEFIGYHPECGIFNVIGKFELRVVGKRKEYYYLEGADKFDSQRLDRAIS